MTLATPTIKDIARELGISYSSVSRALNGKAGVSEKTRSQVEATAREMGYQPNDLARGLVNKVSRTIGVIVPDITNPFFSEIVKGIVETAEKEEYEIFLCVSNWDGKTEKRYLTALRKKQVDGIIIKPSRDYSRDLITGAGLPVVILENSGTHSNAWTVGMNNRSGGSLAARHLLNCGYREIGFLAGKKGSLSSRERMKGWREELRTAGHPVAGSRIVYTDFSVEGGYEAARLLLEEHPAVDGIFAANDVLALGALQYLAEKNISVPEDFGIVGFDNISYSRLPQITLTTISQPMFEMGRLALETMVKILRGAEREVKKEVILEPELVVRTTTRRETRIRKNPPARSRARGGQLENA